jgi:hypothetical protein
MTYGSDDGFETESQAGLGNSKLFWWSVVGGWTMIVIGIAGAIGNARLTKPVEWGAWIIGGAVVHDGVIAPLVLGFGAVLRRKVPQPFRAPLTAGLVLTGLLVVATFPIFSGLGVRDDNPSHLPRDYWMGVGIMLGIVWLGTGALLWRAWRRQRPEAEVGRWRR